MRANLKRSAKPSLEQQLDQLLQEQAAHQWSADTKYVYSPAHHPRTLG